VVEVPAVNWGVIVPAISGAASAVVVAYLALRSKRVETGAPESVAAGYSRLVSDLRDSLAEMRADQAQQHVQIEELRLALERAIAAEQRAVEAERRCMEQMEAMQIELDELRARVAELEGGSL
jgi:chemotaxis regulatin CheY-phosphate phosphatase CheZ